MPEGDGWTDHTGSVDGVQLSWREAGTGDPLVFLHGLGGTRHAWNPQLDAFGAHFRCVAWDMPGYGESSGETPLTFEAITRRLIALLDHLQLDQVDVVGLSFGGMHALHAALAHPHRIRRMVLADTSPAFGMDGTTAEAWKHSRLEAIDAGRTPADIAEAVLDAISAQPLAATVRRDLIEAFGHIGVDGFRAAVDCLPDHDVRARLHELNHRTLVLVGEQDEETPVAYAQVLADGLPNAQMIVLDGIGHLSPSEDPDLFNGHIRRFLGERPAGASSV